MKTRPVPVIDQYDALCRDARREPTVEELYERLRKELASGRKTAG